MLQAKKSIDLLKRSTCYLEALLRLENHSHNLKLQVLTEHPSSKRTNANMLLKLTVMI